MNKLMEALRLFDKVIFNVLKVITIICFVLITILLAGTIIGRHISISFLWSDEIVELLFAYIIFYGTAALWISREHFKAGDWLGSKLIKNDRARQVFGLILELMSFVFVIIFFYYSLKLTLFTEAVTNVLAIPKRVFYSCMPISGAIMIVYSIRNIVMKVAEVRKAKQEVVKGVRSQEPGVR